MKILSLTTENIKRVRAVNISTGGGHVALVGQNEQGKSSVLDSIEYALSGLGSVCERPIRDGESSAKTVIELDDYIVTRTFTAAGGGVLKVEAKNPLPGTVARLSSPQAVLDALVGDLSFDPLEFTRLKPEEQAEILRKLVGINMKVLDDEAALVFNQRTEVNRAISNLTANINGRTYNPALPEAEISAKDIIEARAADQKKNDAYRKAREDYNQITRIEAQTDAEVNDAYNSMVSLERQLGAAKEKLRLLNVQKLALHDQRERFVLPPEDIDLKAFDDQIVEAQQKNFAIRANNSVRDLIATQSVHRLQSASMTVRLEEIATQRERMITEAKYPIVGLGFSSTGTVTFEGIPFKQLSKAQQLKISAAIGIVLNPKLRVMLIRDGSVMDDTTLAALVQVAEVNNTQLWIERVGKTLDGQLPGVIIEDGSVAASTLPKSPEATDSKNTTCV